MTTSENSINWFEIPVTDIDRAKKFYESIFGIEMELESMAGMGLEMALFPYGPQSGKASGCLAQSSMHKPAADGVKIYLNGNPDLATPLSKVNHAGGSIIMPKTQINEMVGYMAFIQDTEGNIIGLHSQA